MLFELKKAVLESGYKQVFVAQQAQIAESRLTRCITGRGKLTGDEKKRLAKVLGKNTSELFPEDEN